MTAPFKWADILYDHDGFKWFSDYQVFVRYDTSVPFRTFAIHLPSDGFFYKGQDVAIVGGGDTAAEEASYLANICNKVTMLIRKDHMRASKAMQHRVKNLPNIDIRFNTEVVSAAWRDGQWQVVTSDGRQERFDVMIAATGPLREKKYPTIPGLEDFAGACFHSADWQEDVALAGKRIGILGTGSSAVQMTLLLPKYLT